MHPIAVLAGEAEVRRKWKDIRHNFHITKPESRNVLGTFV